MSKDLVSICIPVRNGERYLREALASALAQTYRPLEIVVSDDQSSDRSLEIIRDCIPDTDIPMHIYPHQRSGIGANWNHCVRHAGGKYIKFLFQDDFLRPDCVEKMVSVAQLDSTIGLVFCRRSILGEAGNAEHEHWAERLGELHTSWIDLREVNEGRDCLRAQNLLFSPENKIGEPTATLFRKQVFERVGMFSEKYRQCLDFEMYYRLMPYYRVGFVNERLATFRLHAEQATAVNRARGDIGDELEALRHNLFYATLFPFLAYNVKLQLLKEYHPLFGPYRELSRWKKRLRKSLTRAEP